MDATDPDALPERWREPVRLAVTQRMERHEHPEAVAEALRAVRAPPRGTVMDPLGRINAPTLIVASRDEADPTHPRALAEEYARRIPARSSWWRTRARRRWRGRAARLSKAVAGFLESAGYS